MEIVKKNIILFVVLGISVIISGVLFYLVIERKNGYDQSKEKLERLIKQVEDLNRETPAPNKENLDKIIEDIKGLNAKLSNLNKIFGSPYRAALRRFASILYNMKDENGEYNNEQAYDDIRSSWRTFWIEKAKKEISIQKLLKKFLDELKVKNAEGKMEAIPLERQKLAWDEFESVLGKETVEPINPESIQEILLDALGLPRQMRGSSCVKLMSAVFDELNKIRLKAEINVSDSAKYFAFDDFLASSSAVSVPVKENIPYIAKHWKLIEDLIMRLANSKKNKKSELKIEAFSRLNGLLGTKDDKDFLVFKYSIDLIGDLDTIRTFINNLQKAYKDNRVYIVKNITIVKQIDNAKKIRENTERINMSLTTEKKFNFEELQREAKDKQELEIKMRELKRLVIGFNNLVKTTIEFDYIIYIGDELKPKH